MKARVTSLVKPALLAAALLAAGVAEANWPGRFTGGGSVFCPTRVTHGFQLHCGLGAWTGWPWGGGNPREPNNLEVNWDGGNNFHLTDLKAANCFPSVEPPKSGHPEAYVDTMWGYGEGTLNGQPATIAFEITDFGEPGKGVDRFSFDILDAGGGVVLSCSGLLDSGDQQAHKARPKKRVRP